MSCADLGWKEVLLQVNLENCLPVRMRFARSEHRADLVHWPGTEKGF